MITSYTGLKVIIILCLEMLKSSFNFKLLLVSMIDLSIEFDFDSITLLQKQL